MKRIACIGECMIELWQNDQSGESGTMQRTFGGDTLNTAVYLSRCLQVEDARVDYVTALGDDPFSDEMLAAWEAEGIGTGLISRLAGELPGLYIIRTDRQGERSFYYWRRAAAARQLFRAPETGALVNTLSGYDMVYLSGVTLGILGDDSREVLQELLKSVRANGGQVAFDSNYRPRLWGDEAEARRWMERTLTWTTLALPSFADEACLWGDSAPEATAQRLHGLGVAEVVVKQGAKACLLSDCQGSRYVATETVARPVDTTAAGDSFNAAYTAARLAGVAGEAAARHGHRLAARVISQRGAIIPREP